MHRILICPEVGGQVQYTSRDYTFLKRNSWKGLFDSVNFGPKLGNLKCPSLFLFLKCESMRASSAIFSLSSDRWWRTNSSISAFSTSIYFASMDFLSEFIFFLYILMFDGCCKAEIPVRLKCVWMQLTKVYWSVLAHKQLQKPVCTGTYVERWSSCFLSRLLQVKMSSSSKSRCPAPASQDFQLQPRTLPTVQ